MPKTKKRAAAKPESEGLLAKLGSMIKGDGEEGAGPEKATDLLKKDHDKVRALFKRYEETEGPAGRAEIVDMVSKELTIHAHIEEEIFYPAVQKSRETDTVKMVRESFEEHKIVKTLIAELAQVSPRDPQSEAKFTVLKEVVEHHADEEEKDLFPDAERDLSADRLRELGAQMQDRKDELKEMFESGAAPRKRSPATPKKPARSSGSRRGPAGARA